MKSLRQEEEQQRRRRRITDNLWLEKLTWAFGSGELKTETLKGVRVSVGLKFIHWNPYATTGITTRKVGHKHMMINLINFSYITKFSYINWFCTIDK